MLKNWKFLIWLKWEFGAEKVLCSIFVSDMSRYHSYLLGILYVIAVVLLLLKQRPLLLLFTSVACPRPCFIQHCRHGVLCIHAHASISLPPVCANQREGLGLSSGSSQDHPALCTQTNSLSNLFHLCWTDTTWDEKSHCMVPHGSSSLLVKRIARGSVHTVFLLSICSGDAACNAGPKLDSLLQVGRRDCSYFLL